MLVELKSRVSPKEKVALKKLSADLSTMLTALNEHDRQNVTTSSHPEPRLMYPQIYETALVFSSEIAVHALTIPTRSFSEDGILDRDLKAHLLEIVFRGYSVLLRADVRMEVPQLLPYALMQESHVKRYEDVRNYPEPYNLRAWDQYVKE